MSERRSGSPPGNGPVDPRDAGGGSGGGTDGGRSQADPLRARRSQLSAAKRALLARRLRGKRQSPGGARREPGAGAKDAIPRRPDPGQAPLSSAQLRLWRFAQAHPASTIHNVFYAVRLQGALRTALMARALNGVVQRHEALRTRFEVVDGQPVARVVPSLALLLPVVDITAVSEPARDDQALRLLTQGAEKPFDLSRGPLLRAALLRHDPEEHVLLLFVHHIIIDGWSLSVLLRELGTLYEAFVEGKPPALSELPIQYGDFALWQRQRISTEELREQLAYWKKRLTGCPDDLRLPLRRPRPAVRSYPSTYLMTLLSRELSGALKSFAQRQKVTLFIVLLTAFKVLLHRYSGQEDIVVGTPTSSRSHEMLEGLIGLFLNLVALRTDLTGNPSFRELLGRVREETLEAYSHQELPFEELVAELALPEDPRRTPLFQIVLNQPTKGAGPSEVLRFGGLVIAPFYTSEVGSEFDLLFYAVDQAKGIRIHFVYDQELFDAARVEEMSEAYGRLLAQAVADPERRLADFDLAVVS